MAHAVHKPFIEKPCGKPYRRIVQPNHAFDVPSGAAVIPGTHIVLFQQTSGDKFCRKNTARINEAPDPYAFVFQKP